MVEIPKSSFPALEMAGAEGRARRGAASTAGWLLEGEARERHGAEQMEEEGEGWNFKGARRDVARWRNTSAGPNRQGAVRHWLLRSVSQVRQLHDGWHVS